MNLPHSDLFRISDLAFRIFLPDVFFAVVDRLAGDISPVTPVAAGLGAACVIERGHDCAVVQLHGRRIAKVAVAHAVTRELGFAPYPRSERVGPLGYAPWSEGLGIVLRRLHDELPGRPLLICEHGVGTDDDDWRSDVLRESLTVIETVAVSVPPFPSLMV